MKNRGKLGNFDEIDYQRMNYGIIGSQAAS